MNPVLAVLLIGATFLAGYSPDLPEGEKAGLSAGFAGDKGIEAHPDVLHTDGFEDVKGEAMSGGYRTDKSEGWNNRWDTGWGQCLVPTDKKKAHSGDRCMEITAMGPSSHGLSKNLPQGYDKLFMRYYVRYGKDFPGAHHVGGAIESRAPGVPHANPGFVADGKNKYTILLDHWSFDPEVKQPGHLVLYVYHMDQKHQWGEQFYPSGKIMPGTNMWEGLLGSDFVKREDLIPERGKWYCYELMVQANTPGEKDGRLAFWVDGKLRGDFSGLRFRTVPDLKINRVDLGLYESRENRLGETVWFDDVVVATSYIGPRRGTP